MSSDDTEDDVDGDLGANQELPPEITTVLRNRDVKEGGRVQFTCCAISRLPVTAEWYKDEQLIDKWPRFKQHQDDIMFTLTISDAKTTDAGHFKFVVKNALGQVENNAYLNVERMWNVCWVNAVLVSLRAGSPGTGAGEGKGDKGFPFPVPAPARPQNPKANGEATRRLCFGFRAQRRHDMLLPALEYCLFVCSRLTWLCPSVIPRLVVALSLTTVA